MPLRITNSTTDVASINRWAEDVESRLGATSKQSNHAVTAVKQILATPSPASPITLNVPDIFTPVSQTSSSLFSVALAPENANTFLAGPSGTATDLIDHALVTAVGSTTAVSITATPKQPSDLAMALLCTDSSNGGNLIPDVSWTQPGVSGANEQMFFKNVSGTSPATLSGTIGSTSSNWSAALALFTANPGFTPALIHSATVFSGAFNSWTNSGIGFTPTAGNTLVAVVMSGNTSFLGGSASVVSFTDSQGDVFVPLGSVINSSGQGTEIIVLAASKIVGGATTFSGVLSRTVSNGIVVVFEITNLAPVSGLPTFRPIVGKDLPNPSPVSKGGVFSKAAVTHNFLTSVNLDGTIGQVQPAASDLSNGTTGSGAVVLAGSPTLTGTAALPIVTLSGKITNYNGIATVSDGVPAEYATVDLTAQTAAIGATTLYTTSAIGAGVYRISWVAKVTTAATTSSTLGGAAGFQATYTDADDSVVVTPLAVPNASATGNTTQTQLSGTVIMNVKASTNIQYQFGYTTSGTTSMAYNLHIKLEAL